MCPQSFVLTLLSIVFYYKIIYESSMKYLIRIWHQDILIKDLTWESDDEVKLYREVAESVPRNYRVTIENDKREDKNARVTLQNCINMVELILRQVSWVEIIKIFNEKLLRLIIVKF
jgi:hypothetical protein